jgi:hypothetical protein
MVGVEVIEKWLWALVDLAWEHRKVGVGRALSLIMTFSLAELSVSLHSPVQAWNWTKLSRSTSSLGHWDALLIC